MTDHEHTEAVTLAAQWLADERHRPHPVVAVLRSRFGLSAKEACEAIGMAQRFRVVREAHG